MTSARTQIPCLLLIACAASLLALLGTGCADREHIRDDYGQRVRAFQVKQRVYAQAASGGTVGLDSEESAAIHKAYRTGLSGKGSGGGDSNRVLILGEAPHGGSK